MSANSFRLLSAAVMMMICLSVAGWFAYRIAAGHSRIERCVASGFTDEPTTREACERAERQGRL